MNKDELEAQIRALNAQLEQVSHEFKVGDKVFTSFGLAEIVNFYTEDGIDKIQSIIHHLDSETETRPTGQQVLCSMPIDVFKKRIKDYWKGQKQRKIIEEKKRRMTRGEGEQ